MLALAMLAAMALPVAAADAPVLTLTLPEKLPAVGESFTVTVDLSGNPGLSAAQLLLCYDDTVLECTAARTGSVLGGMLSAANTHKTDGQVGAIVAAAASENVTKDGALASFTFRVKAAGDAGLRLADVMLGNEDGEKLAFTTNEVKTSETLSETPGMTPDESPDESADEPYTYSDVPTSHWAHEHISRASELGLVNGMGGGRYQPDANVTRAQFVTILYRAAGEPEPTKEPTFTDLDPAQTWAYKAIAWAAETGIVTGYSAERFGPNDLVTREQLWTVLFRWAGGVSGLEQLLYPGLFTDQSDVSAWAKDALWWAVFNNVYCGVDSVDSGETLKPKLYATRAQIAVAMVRYYDAFGAEKGKENGK